MFVLAAGFVLEEKDHQACAVVWDQKRLKIKGGLQNCSFCMGAGNCCQHHSPQGSESLQKHAYTGSPHFRVLQNKAATFKEWRSFQNYFLQKENNFTHCRPLMNLLERSHLINSPLCGSSPPSNIHLKMKFTFFLPSLKFPVQTDSQIILILILILKSTQKKGNFLIINGRKALFSISKCKV